MGTDGEQATAPTQSTTRRRALFRWIKAARYVVTLAVTVLIVVMIAQAIKVVGRQRKLIITVTGGSMTVVPPRSPSDNFTFSTTFQATNPGGLGQIYYTNVRVFVAGKLGSSSSLPEKLFSSHLDDMVVLPRVTMNRDSIFPDSNIPPKYRDYFSKRNTMRDAVLRINGTLQTELYNGYNTTAKMAVYCCEPIVVGDVDDDYSPTPDTICKGPDTTMENCEMISS